VDTTEEWSDKNRFLKIVEEAVGTEYVKSVENMPDDLLVVVVRSENGQRACEFVARMAKVNEVELRSVTLVEEEERGVEGEGGSTPTEVEQ